MAVSLAKKKDYSYKKTRLMPGNTPDEAVQQAFVSEIQQMLSEAEETGAAVLFLDPMHQIHNNENGYMWQLRGAEGTAQIPSNSGRRRLNIIGAINPHTLTPTTLLIEGSCDKEVIIAFLELIKQDYPQTRSITVVLDNAAYNRAYDVVEKAEQLGITLKYLPPYSPNLNLIERLWKFFKKKVTKNTYYSTFDEFYQAVVNFFKHFDQYHGELASLLAPNFEIIKAV